LVTLPTSINVPLLKSLSHGFTDTQVCDLIQFGFPLDLDKSKFSPATSITNHGSALKFPVQVDKYFTEESKFNSMLGPFEDPLFADLHCSPLLTAPKDGTKRQSSKLAFWNLRPFGPILSKNLLARKSFHWPRFSYQLDFCRSFHIKLIYASFSFRLVKLIIVICLEILFSSLK
jgi:hypothetical protein